MYGNVGELSSSPNQKKSIKFLAIEHKKLVAGVKNEEYEEVMEEAFTQSIHDNQFKYYSTRFRFVEVFKAEPMKAKFLRLIKTRKATYTDMLPYTKHV